MPTQNLNNDCKTEITIDKIMGEIEHKRVYDICRTGTITYFADYIYKGFCENSI